MAPDDSTPDWVDSSPAGRWDPWGDDEASPEHRGLDRTLGQWLEAVVPPDAQVHFLTAATEFAAGVQTTFDYHLRGRAGDGGSGDGDEGQPVRIEIE